MFRLGYKGVFGHFLFVLAVLKCHWFVSGATGWWTWQQDLVANDGATISVIGGDFFGVSVALDGDTAVVGANQDDDNGSNSGSVYVFVRSGTTWTQQRKLVANDGTEYDLFGTSVALDGDTAVVGATGDDDNGSHSGSAYVFFRSGTTWTQQQKLVANDGASQDYFSNSVALDGDIAVIGAPGHYMSPNSGSVYVFFRSGTTWSQQQKLVAGDGAAGDAFGVSVALDGDTAVVGVGDNVDGFLYVFVRSGTTWTQQQKLVTAVPDRFDGDGKSVALDGHIAVSGVSCFLLVDSCDASTAPTNGGVGNCTSSLAYGATCQPTCNNGYTVSGTSSCTAGNVTSATCFGNSCDASSPPTNGGVGTCTNSLAHGSTCQPTCSSGYTVSGTSSCNAGTLTAATCSGNSCDASSAPANGGVGDCTSSLAHGSTCQPTCSSGYTVSGTSSCSLGTLTAATCSGNPCDASTAPTNGGVGTCTSSLAHGSTCQPTCSSGYTVSGTSSCNAGTLTAATCSVNSPPPPFQLPFPLPPPSPPSPPPAKASFTASYTINGYTKSSFGLLAQDKFKKAVADILGILPGAVQILSIYNTFKRRTLLAASDKISISFKVDALDDSDAAGLSTSILSVPESHLVARLQNFGLSEVTEASIPTNVVFYAPPPSTTTIQTENSSSSNNTTLIGAAIGVVSLPAIILAIMKVFASKALRAFLLKFGGFGRWVADLIVPDTQGDVKKISVKMKDVEAFMVKQKLPRLVNTTPSLDESLIIVEKSKPLGRGGFGVVFKGNMLRSSTKKTQRVAVKCLFNPTQDPMKAVVPDDIAKQMNREATILCSLNHPNIIRIFGIVLKRGWIIMELCARGSLRSILLDKDNALETAELVRFASETATGVAYLHATEVSIIHGDLKADNVLVREDGSVCLCDFGMSEAKDRSKSMTTAVGVSSGSGSGGLTVQWSAPELLKGKRKDRASDVFALAVTLWEIFERNTPFGGMADMIVINQILAGIRPEFENTPSEFRAVVGKAWGDDAKSRPKAAQIACVLSN